MNRAAQLYGLSPLAILRLPVEDFHFLLAMAVAALEENAEPLRRARRDDFASGIAAAVAMGVRAAR